VYWNPFYAVAAGHSDGRALFDDDQDSPSTMPGAWYLLRVEQAREHMLAMSKLSASSSSSSSSSSSGASSSGSADHSNQSTTATAAATDSAAEGAASLNQNQSQE